MAHRRLFPLPLLALALVGAGAVLSLSLRSALGGDERAFKEAELFAQVRRIVLDEYVEARDSRELLHAALKGMVASLDPYSRFYGPGDLAALERETRGAYEGIGVVIEPAAPPLTILFPYPGSPAARAGLEVGDRILAVDGRRVEDLEPAEGAASVMEKARGLIMGPAGSEVALVVRRAERELEVRVTRGSIQAGSVKWARNLGESGRAGYLHVSDFQENTVADLDLAVERLRRQGAKGLVLDLRFNRGGMLDAAVRLVNRFLEEGAIVALRGRTPASNVTHRANPREARLKGMPLVVLINEESASASEVAAGAVRDHALGLLVGGPTWGKGAVQTVRRIPRFDVAAKLTTAWYTTPSGQAIARRSTPGEEGEEATGGIVPHVEVPMARRAREALRARLAAPEPPPELREAVETLRARLDLSQDTGPAAAEEDPQLAGALETLEALMKESALHPAAPSARRPERRRG